jgi:sirohydrochlorin cobaltochelatase
LGLERILAVPGMLFAAGHAKNDIPSVLNTYAAGHRELTVTYGRELGVDLKMLRAAGDRIEAALAAAPDQSIQREETLLLVVGRGASDPDANSNVAKVMRMLWEGMGFGWAEVAYSGVTFPLVAPALAHAAKLGYRRIVVFPYFLFTGVLVNRIYDAVDEATAAYPEIDFLKAPYLSDHPLVIDTFVDRLREMLIGQNLMNCAMCKYREQVLGFEAEIGLAQESHHHHVEGIGGGLENCPCAGDCDGSCRDEAFCRRHGLPWTPLHTDADNDVPHIHAHPPRHALSAGPAPLVDFGPGPRFHVHADGSAHTHDHGDAHDHGHAHHPYPHADHPLGPKTLPEIQGRLARRERDEP